MCFTLNKDLDVGDYIRSPCHQSNKIAAAITYFEMCIKVYFLAPCNDSCFQFYIMLEILHIYKIRSHVDKIVGCSLHIYWVSESSYYHMFLGNSNPPTRGFVGLSLWVPHGRIHTRGPMGRSCDELSWPNTLGYHTFSWKHFRQLNYDRCFVRVLVCLKFRKQNQKREHLNLYLMHLTPLLTYTKSMWREGR